MFIRVMQSSKVIGNICENSRIQINGIKEK